MQAMTLDQEGEGGAGGGEITDYSKGGLKKFGKTQTVDALAEVLRQITALLSGFCLLLWILVRVSVSHDLKVHGIESRPGSRLE